MSIDPVFGPLVTDEDIQVAVRDTIKDWLETYLAAIERHVGLEPRSLPLPRSYVLEDSDQLRKGPEDQLPCIAILAPGTARAPEMDGEGNYRAAVVISVSAIVSAGGLDSQANTSRLAKRYRKALEMLLVQQGSLGGFATATVFKGWSTNDLKPEDNRTIAAGMNLFEVLVPNVVQRGAGLKAPPEDPYEEIELPTVEEVDVVLKPEEIA